MFTVFGYFQINYNNYIENMWYCSEIIHYKTVHIKLLSNLDHLPCAWPCANH